jgi:predicted PurR-regulated permease PerM
VNEANAGEVVSPVESSRKSAPRWPYLIFVLVALAMNLYLFRYFLVTMAAASAVAVVFISPFEGLTAKLHGRRGLAAGIATALLALVVIAPIGLWGTLLVRQAVELFEALRPLLEPDKLSDLWIRELPQRYPWIASIQRTLGIVSVDAVMSRVAPMLSNIVGGTNQVLQSTLAGITTAVLYVILFLFAMFFLLRDGRLFADNVFGLLPFSPGERHEILRTIRLTTKGVLYSAVLVPVVQGLVAMLGFWVLGLSSPFFWGTMLMFAAAIPGVGAPLVWAPAAVYLLFASAVWKGIVLALYGALGISLIDNFLKPVILHGTARIHPFAAFLSILGGLLTFGPAGLILGPVTFSLLQTLVRIRQSQRPVE